MGIGVLVGAGLRVWVLGRAPITSDEAVVGLMARQILHGHFSAFYWGQTYGGVEPYATALLFLVFGQSGFVIGLTPVILAALTAVLLWRFGRRVFSPSVGVAAALLYWLWPLADVLRSTYSDGIRGAALVLGMLVLLFSRRIVDRRRPRNRARAAADWAVLGLATGAGWWATPEIAYFLLGAGALLLVQLVRRRLALGVAELAAFIPALGLGALPWIWANVRSHLATVHDSPPAGRDLGSHLATFFAHVLPMSLGLQLPATGDWLTGRGVGLALYAVVALALLAWCGLLVRRLQALDVVAFVVAFPFLYAVSPYSSFWEDGRYAVYIAPALSLLVVSGGQVLLRHAVGAVGIASSAVRRWAGPVLCVAAGVGLTLGGAPGLTPFAPGQFGPAGVTTWRTWHSDPAAPYGRLAVALQRVGVHEAVAGYWVAYELTFESRGSLVATDLRFVRYQPYVAQVLGASRCAWVFDQPVGAEGSDPALGYYDPGGVATAPPFLYAAQLESWLDAHDIAYRSVRVGDLLALVPARRVPPVTVFTHFGVPVVVG